MGSGHAEKDFHDLTLVDAVTWLTVTLRLSLGVNKMVTVWGKINLVLVRQVLNYVIYCH